MSEPRSSITGPGARSPHTFHIPVMGTGFTVDTPLRVARYGISSVISLVDDVLLEQMRGRHCRASGESFVPIASCEQDARARRITAYLNLVDRLVARQSQALQAAPFEPGSEITRYFELLPEGALKRAYRAMLASASPSERAALQAELRLRAVPGRIDVNIMTKLDRDNSRAGEKLPPEFADAMAALRGFAQSTLRSCVVFSAGLNQRLFTYAAQFPDFFPDPQGHFKKGIVLKVSDFRSAEVQGRFLAKRGLWVGECRVESGLNCGGHAFATKGFLMGPILEEFRGRREELRGKLFAACAAAWAERGIGPFPAPPPMKLTVQGGIGTSDEDLMLREVFSADGTGWGTPFLLVPEATNVDPELLLQLSAATAGDVYLSRSSPLGIPYWNLRSSASERERRQRILADRPGSPCMKGFLMSNTEFTREPICTASHGYQSRKLKALREQDLPQDRRAALEDQVLEKSCICHDLGGSAALLAGIAPDATPAVCPGPGIAYFSRIASLEEMLGHIYGRQSLFSGDSRPHMFLNELDIYLNYLQKEAAQFAQGLTEKTPAYFKEFSDNLSEGIAYYAAFAERLAGQQRQRFLAELAGLRAKLASLNLPAAAIAPST